MSQKSYDNTPTLYLIPTPIGNLDDMTFRGVQILQKVEVIFSEDTRVTSLLLHHFNISKRLISSHNYNEKENVSIMIKYLKNVSDRGTPIISDPGYELALAAMKNGYNVVGLPGANALIPALIMSGICPMPFLFYGFLNSKESKRKEELANLKMISATLIFYEAPHRLHKTLHDIYNILGNRQVSISREISKKFEEVYRGSIKEVIEQIVNIKGEIVIVVAPDTETKVYDNLTIIEHIHMYIKEGYDAKEAIKKVAHDRHISKNEVYQVYHRGDVS